MYSGIKGKRIILGVCGGIAAYKCVELVRSIRKLDGHVRVIMTKSAREFVGPLTFTTVSERPACTTIFDDGTGEDGASVNHIAWAEEADAVVVAPATANFLGKLANGIADDALSTFMLAVTAPVVICPSMNSNMYLHPAVQRNIRVLQKDGHLVLEPGSGDLACGTTGPGRLPEPPEILDRLVRILTPRDLKNKKILVTAGPTREPIDPVRFISNPSSGKMGYAVARAAEHRGADVVLVSGPTELADPIGVTVIRVHTAGEMAEAVFNHMPDAHAVIKTAAVSDYRPRDPAEQKIKKGEATETLELVQNMDILKELGARKLESQVLVGFAAETEELEKNAQKKLAAKNLDMIAANLVNRPASGFGTDTNRVTLYFREGEKESLPLMGKDEISHLLLDRVVSRMKDKDQT